VQINPLATRFGSLWCLLAESTDTPPPPHTHTTYTQKRTLFTSAVATLTEWTSTVPQLTSAVARTKFQACPLGGERLTKAQGLARE
jgi:hypothetical protein